MKNKLCLLLVVFLVTVFPTTNYASYNQSSRYSRDGLSLSVAPGVLSGESREYVYNEDNSLLSQLNWKIKNAPIIKGEINYDILPWLTANGRGWSIFTGSRGSMDDYDWLNPYQAHWTDWSHHENTMLNYANDIDLNLRGWILKNQNYKLGVAAGYEQTAFNFNANGGCYQYASGHYVGCFENIPVIGYQQTFRAPYLGLAGQFKVDKFEFGALLKISQWVHADDTDNHYLRNLTFREYGTKSKYQSATIDAGYLYSEHTKFFAEASFNHFSEARAGTEIIDNDTGEMGYLPNSAGLGNKNYTFSLGVKYRL